LIHQIIYHIKKKSQEDIRAKIIKIAKKKIISQKAMTDFEDWKAIQIPLFDNMVHNDQLFQLCAIIGGTLLHQMQEITVFYGDVGKTTMCRIIQALAAKRGIAYTKDSTMESAMKSNSGICYFQEGVPIDFEKILSGNLLEWRPMWKWQKEIGYWYFPTFVCSQTKISSPNVYNILMKSPKTKNPDFLAGIDFDLVEKKCCLAYQEFRRMLSNPTLELLNKI
jgi:hypothetical protein